MAMTISEVARRAGCSAPTIRFYEGIGLVAPAARTSGGRRSYGWPDISRLQFIRRARDFGMSIDQVRTLLALSRGDEGACQSARALIQDRLLDVRARRRELAALEASLKAMAGRCDESCGADGSQPCTIFDDMAGVA